MPAPLPLLLPPPPQGQCYYQCQHHYHYHCHYHHNCNAITNASNTTMTTVTTMTNARNITMPTCTAFATPFRIPSTCRCQRIYCKPSLTSSWAAGPSSSRPGTHRASCVSGWLSCSPRPERTAARRRTTQWTRPCAFSHLAGSP